MTVLLILLGIVMAAWSREAWIHRRALRAIPVRIHVNGSRGKSSVTRLLAAAIREADLRTVAKVTGSKARLILPDGSDEPVIRLGTPNICEQIAILDRARREGAQVMVMECMAVRPDLQRITEKHVMRATIGVITNIRPDHLDVMGPTVDDVALALSSTIPDRAVAVLGDARYSGLMGRVARERGTVLRVARPDLVPASAMRGFAYLEHEENVATVLEVTRQLGIDDEVALRGMYKAPPDVGACSRWAFRHQGRAIEFHNIFAANDLESTVTVWRKLGLAPYANGGAAATVALLNLRADRVDRSLQYAEAVEKGLNADHYVVIGGLTPSVMRKFQAQVPDGRLWTLGNCPPGEVFDRIASFGREKVRVGAVGNIGGLGHQVLDFVARGAQAGTTGGGAAGC